MFGKNIFFSMYFISVLYSKCNNLFVGPRIGEPPDNPRLQLLGHSSKGHVLFNAVHSVLELDSGHVHVADHTADVAHDRGKNEHAGQEISHYEHVFQFVFRLRCLSCKRTANIITGNVWFKTYELEYVTRMSRFNSYLL